MNAKAIAARVFPAPEASLRVVRVPRTTKLRDAADDMVAMVLALLFISSWLAASTLLFLEKFLW